MFWGFPKICGMVEVLLILFIQKTEKHLQTKSPQLLCYRLGELTLYKVCVILANEGHSQYVSTLSGCHWQQSRNLSTVVTHFL